MFLKNFKNNLKKKCSYSLVEYSKEYLTKINVEAGTGLFNRKCHLNSVDYALKNNLTEVAILVSWSNDNEEPFIHFVNVVNQKYIDNTLGALINYMTNYLIEIVNIKDCENPYHSITDKLVEIKNQYKKVLPKYHKICKYTI